MAFSRTLMACAALALAMGGCTTTDAPPVAAAVDAGPYAGRSVLDVAIETAGGEAALGKVQEIYFTGAATVTAEGKTAEQNLAIVVRPFSFYRLTTWAKGAEPRTAKTVQAEMGKAWDVTRVTWQPMPEPAAKFENEQLGLYSALLLTPLKADGVNVKELPAGADGSRSLQVTRANAKPVEVTFDASGRLARATYTGTDPKTGADAVETATFSGEIVSNGVKWPKTIKVERGGAPAMELEVATFEALPQRVVRPLEQTMQYDGSAPPSDDDAG